MGNHREVSSLPPGRRVRGLHRQHPPGPFPNDPTPPPPNVEQLVFPSALKPDVLASFHNMGHQGLDRTIELLRARVYWPGMFGEVRSYIHACQRCTMGRKPATNTTSGHLIALRPLEVLAIDFTKLDQASDGRENVHDGRFYQVHAGSTYQEPRSRHRRQSPGP